MCGWHLAAPQGRMRSFGLLVLADDDTASSLAIHQFFLAASLKCVFPLGQLQLLLLLVW
jgi:hypothetical protein